MAVAHAPESDTGQNQSDAHHAPDDPNAAPTHLDVRTEFSVGQMAVIWALGAIAIIAGIVVGLTVVNN